MEQQQQTQGDVAHTNAIIERLRERYLNHMTIPSTDAKPLTITEFYRLYRHVIEEGYGQ
jgi:hypothetical protein